MHDTPGQAAFHSQTITSDSDATDLTAGAANLSAHLGVHLALGGHYNDALITLTHSLCRRIAEADSRAPMEYWRLLQGLHYGGALSAGSLDQQESLLSDLVPHWCRQ